MLKAPKPLITQFFPENRPQLQQTSIPSENGEPKIRYTRGKSFARLMFGIGDAEETGSCRVYKKQF